MRAAGLGGAVRPRCHAGDLPFAARGPLTRCPGPGLIARRAYRCKLIAMAQPADGGVLMRDQAKPNIVLTNGNCSSSSSTGGAEELAASRLAADAAAPVAAAAAASTSGGGGGHDGSAGGGSGADRESSGKNSSSSSSSSSGGGGEGVVGGASAAAPASTIAGLNPLGSNASSSSIDSNNTSGGDSSSSSSGSSSSETRGSDTSSSSNGGSSHGESPSSSNAAAAEDAAAAATATAADAAAAEAAAGGSGRSAARAAGAGAALYPPAERSQIRGSWDTLMRWSRFFRRQQAGADAAGAARKVVVFGGGSFGTAMGASVARKWPDLDVVLLLRDEQLAADINGERINTKYLPGMLLPPNMRATTDAADATAGAGYAVHAVPVQHSRAFLEGVRDLLAPTTPIVCVSKGLEVGTGMMMSDVIPSALGRRQPATFISGPSFAREVMEGRPTGVVAASRDPKLARQVQALFASPCMRVNTSTDVVGVEVCGALKNVLAIAAGIVQGLDLGHNALAALVAQGCAEIRWLAEKLGAKPQTMAGLSGLGDIMLTCYGDLSRNRAVGVRLGKGERLEDILGSSTQVAEGVATAGVVVGLARRYRVSLPVLTAVAQVLDAALTPAEAVAEIMSLPQIEEH